MQVRAAASILGKALQGDSMTRITEIRKAEGGRDWTDHSAEWIPINKPYYNTCLEEILAIIGENRERDITWDFYRCIKEIWNLENRDPELGTKDILWVIWEVRN